MTQPVRRPMRRRTLLIGLHREPPESPPSDAQINIGYVAAQTPTSALSEDSFSYRRCVSVRSGLDPEQCITPLSALPIGPGGSRSNRHSEVVL